MARTITLKHNDISTGKDGGVCGKFTCQSTPDNHNLRFNNLLAFINRQCGWFTKPIAVVFGGRCRKCGHSSVANSCRSHGRTSRPCHTNK